MTFSIEFCDGVVEDLPEDEAYGEITMGEFYESFRSPTNYWTRQQYEAQWQSAVSDVVEGRSKKSCMVTSIYDPVPLSRFVFVWVIYVVDDTAIFRNMLLDTWEVYQDFDETEPSKCLPDRGMLDEDGLAINEEGDRIPEYHVPIESLKAFVGN